MALEGLSLARAPAEAETEVGGGRLVAAAAVNGGGGGDDGSKAPRLPRWTRQEILVLIQGKRVAESRVRRRRTAGMEFGSGQVEPKWASVSSYCKRHGVNRGPVQCRKRWSNLAGDYKKIKEWESQIREETESFWVMRNDLRRERKLPGFFDREVYDILDRGDDAVAAAAAEEVTGALALALGPSVAPGTDDPDPETLFDSGRSAAADDGLFSDFEQSGQEEAGVASPRKDLPAAEEVPPTAIPAPIPISEQQYEPFSQETPAQGTSHQKQAASEPDLRSGQEGRKRKRNMTDTDADADEESENLQHQLVKALERNGKLLSSQLEAQNAHLQLDREQRKDHVNSLIAVLNKLSDALGRIADKL
ncbi:PREDICTED: trihelix transcription factor ASR3 isoform X2 [Ipomoea nil]|uniref:trihelix transcription factor ASR3 isoform X2 n=1 Tax=Ipomoea nil TaxID=35883 RepID=UPI000901CABB|nr:PREDICTED: trihelix transcription factor ASR3 isoform X2 [Ipomoea nil]